MIRPSLLARWRNIAGAAALTSLLAAATPGSADDRAAAQALFDAGKALSAAGNHAEACPKFEASYKLDKTLGTLLNLADCHENVGKLATAWAEFGEAHERARRAGDNRAEFAKQRQDALGPRLPKLQITVKNPRPNLVVVRDDARVEEPMYNVALPIDPGKHTVLVNRDDQVIHQQSVETAEGATATVTLDLAAIERAAPAPKPKSTTTPPGGAAPPESSSQKTIGFIVGGVGLAAVLGAGVLEVIALTKKPGSDQCVNEYCAPAGFSSAQDAKTFANVGQWLGIGGLTALAVGVTLVLTAPSSPEPGKSSSAPKRQRAAVPEMWAKPLVVPTGGGISLGARL